ncbi:hypothetical protein NQ315_017109 [Exocentrus adspersus]|uniref:Mitochondrial inner membrane protein Mpv17 n=1 Tax=Exocentrus adspersus TaxID=1586481 RepID=A0AAV8VH93_9CUCU|nr:hypothetical protein NQ315_017109 [Exocentrus adspersus]
MNTFLRLRQFYRRMLCRRPILVQSVQTGAVMGLGDVLTQKFIEKKCELDCMRTARYTAFGSFITGPALSIWYRTLDRYIGSCGKASTLKKMVLGQLVFAPPFLLVFLLTIKMMQGDDFECIVEEVRVKYKDILYANWKVWPAAQLCVFRFVPLLYQVLASQVIALFFNMYLSWKAEQELEKD